MLEAIAAAGLPDGWEDELNAKADFARSFRRLRPCTSLRSLIMRGQVRALQLRHDMAWRYFGLAFLLARRSVSTLEDLYVSLQLNLAMAEWEILTRNPIGWLAPPAMQPVPAQLESEPELLSLTWRLRRLNGAVHLCNARLDEARDVFAELVEMTRGAEVEERAASLLGLGCALYNQGEHARARELLAHVGRLIRTGGLLLKRGRLSANLLAISRFLGLPDSTEWRTFLARLDCPPATHQAFLGRADLILRRMKEHRRLVAI